MEAFPDETLANTPTPLPRASPDETFRPVDHQGHALQYTYPNPPAFPDETLALWTTMAMHSIGPAGAMLDPAIVSQARRAPAAVCRPTRRRAARNQARTARPARPPARPRCARPSGAEGGAGQRRGRHAWAHRVGACGASAVVSAACQALPQERSGQHPRAPTGAQRAAPPRPRGSDFLVPR